MSDDEYDELKDQLRKKNSKVVQQVRAPASLVRCSLVGQEKSDQLAMISSAILGTKMQHQEQENI